MITTMLLLIGCGSVEPGPKPLVGCDGADELRREPTEEGGQAQWCEVGALKEGAYVRVRADGSQAETGAYALGQQDGPWVAWHPNGEMAYRGRYSAGHRVGTWTWWHDNGVVARQGDFLQGREQGRFVENYPSGRPKLEGLYHNGLKTERWTSFADSDGSPVEKSEIFNLGELAQDGALVDDARAFLADMHGCWPTIALAAVLGSGERTQGVTGAVECWKPMGARWLISRNDTEPGAVRSMERAQLQLHAEGADFEVRRAQDQGPNGVRRVLSQSDPPVALVLTEASPTSLVFKGPDGGYPAIVRYDRAGPMLTVRYEGIDAGAPRSAGWTFQTDVDLDDPARLNGVSLAVKLLIPR